MVCEYVLAEEHPGTILLMTVSVFSLLTSSGILFLTHIQFVEALFADHEEEYLITGSTTDRFETDQLDLNSHLRTH